MRRVGAKNRAMGDQIVAMLRDQDGFPMSSGQIAKALGGHWWTPPSRARRSPRPDCWPDDFTDPGDADSHAFCPRCRRPHRGPVWRNYDASDVRPTLLRLERECEVERVMFNDGPRRVYWRRDDSDAPLSGYVP